MSKIMLWLLCFYLALILALGSFVGGVLLIIKGLRKKFFRFFFDTVEGMEAVTRNDRRDFLLGLLRSARVLKLITLEEEECCSDYATFSFKNCDEEFYENEILPLMKEAGWK